MPEPGPRPSTGITRLLRYHEPLRLPHGPRLTLSDHPGGWDATHHLCGSRTLPRKPCAHADPTTPAGESWFFGRLLPRSPTAFPLWRKGRLQRVTIEACSGFTRAFRPAHLHLGCTEDFPRGFSRTITRTRLLQWLPGEPTIPRTGLSPVGLRDPGGLSMI